MAGQEKLKSEISHKMATRLKKGSKAAKDFMAKIRKMRKKKSVSGVKKPANRQTGTSLKKYDKLISAKKPGKRKSASGKTYTERRANRSDKGKLLGIGNIEADIKRKIGLVIDHIAKLSGDVAKHKALYAYGNKVKHNAAIKSAKKKISELNKLKTKLSKFK